MMFCNGGGEAEDDEDGPQLDANQRKFDSGARGYWRYAIDCFPLSLRFSFLFFRLISLWCVCSFNSPFKLLLCMYYVAKCRAA